MRTVKPDELSDYTIETKVFPYAATATTRFEKSLGIYDVASGEIRQTVAEEFQEGVGLDNPLDYLADREEKPGEYNTGSAGDFKMLRKAVSKETEVWHLLTHEELKALDKDGDGKVSGTEMMGIYLHQGAEEIGLDEEGSHLLPAWLPFPLSCEVQVLGGKKATERFMVVLEDIDLKATQARWRIFDRVVSTH